MLSMMLNEVVHPPPPPPPPEDDSTAMAPAPRFPTYLLPSFSRPFRRHRQTSSSGSTITQKAVSSLTTSLSDSPPSSPGESTPASSPTSTTSPTSPASSASSWFSYVKDSFRHPSVEQSNAPRLTRIQLDTIRCATCGADFAFSSQIVSKGFTGRHGRAYLISPPERPLQKPGPNLMNIKVGKPETRVLTTGTHVVCDIQCTICRARVGWKYVDAKEETQKYKIGKFILEIQRTVRYGNWDDTMVNETLELGLEEQDASSGSDTDPVMFDSDDSDDCDDLFAGVWDAKTAARRRKLKKTRRWG